MVQSTLPLISLFTKRLRISISKLLSICGIRILISIFLEFKLVIIISYAVSEIVNLSLPYPVIECNIFFLQI